MHDGNNRDAKENSDEGMTSKGPTEAGGVDPGNDEEGVDEGRHVQHHGVEGHHSHALHWVCIYNVGADGCVAHLNSGADCRVCVSMKIQGNEKKV